MTVTNLAAVARRITAAHEHVTIGEVNDHCVILAVNEEPYPWHEHPDSDEIFIVLEGTLRLELADGAAVELGPLETSLVPAGTVHRTTPLGRCVNLVFERAGTETRFVDEGP